MRLVLAVPAAVPLIAAAPVPCEPLQESYAALFERALESIARDFAAEQAFTETESGNDGDFVGRYDPRNPRDERWTLLSIAAPSS